MIWTAFIQRVTGSPSWARARSLLKAPWRTCLPRSTLGCGNTSTENAQGPLSASCYWSWLDGNAGELRPDRNVHAGGHCGGVWLCALVPEPAQHQAAQPAAY